MAYTVLALANRSVSLSDVPCWRDMALAGEVIRARGHALVVRVDTERVD